MLRNALKGCSHLCAAMPPTSSVAWGRPGRTVPHSALLRGQHRALCAPSRARDVQSAAAAAVETSRVTAGLNRSQELAVTSTEGHCRVVAGPGSGKTRVLTKRVAYLVEACGVPAEDILAITFTRKGSAEMKQRLQRELPPAAAAAVTIGTFHAIAFRVLRRYIHMLPGTALNNQFTVATDKDEERHLDAAVADLDHFGNRMEAWQWRRDAGELPETSGRGGKAAGTPSREEREQWALERKAWRCLRVPADTHKKEKKARLSALSKAARQVFRKVHRLGLDVYPPAAPHGASGLERGQAVVRHFHALAKSVMGSESEGRKSSFVTGLDRSDKGAGEEFLLQVWPVVAARVHELREAQNVVGTDTFVSFVNTLLATQPRVAARLRGYRHVLVDEVQDNDRSQYNFVRHLSDGGSSIFFVGDPNQCIYEFRGADGRLFRQVCLEHYPAISSVELPENYRSVASVVRASRAVLRSTKPGTLTLPTPMRQSDITPLFADSENPDAEAANITSFVRALRRMGHPLREIAVLYPLHVHGDRIEEGLLRAAVPLQRASRNTIADSAVGRDLFAFASVMVNPTNDTCLNRIYNTPRRGMGDQGWSKLRTEARKNAPKTSFGAHLFGDLRECWVAADVVQEALDAYVDAPADQQHEALQAALQRRAAELAPPIGAEIGGVRISARQQKPLQELRNVFVCVRSEAARFGPDRANAVLQALVGYRVKEIGDDGDRERVAAFFITQELGAGSGGEAALEAVSGKWDEFSGADGDAPQWQPPPADCLGESSARPQQPMDFDKLLLRPPALRADCDPAAPLEDQGGMHALHEVVSKLAFIDDTSPKDAAGGGEDAVQLMTLHKAKGLEFSVVILVGLDNSGLFRGDAAAAELDVVDQATNLVYVGVTRTENLLVVSAVERDPLPHWQKFGRGGYGRGGGGPRAEPSRMLQAMYDEFDVEVPQGWSCARKKLRALGDLLAAEGRPLQGA